MQRYEVGTLYYPGKTRWQDGSDFNYRSNSLELRLFFSGLTPSDIAMIRNGPCSFHLALVDDLLFFLFEFGKACPLSDNSYSWWLVSAEERTIPPILSPNEQAILTIILVSAEDGIIRALRQIALSHHFSKTLYDAIQVQTQQTFDTRAHERKLARVYAQYPSSQALLTRACASCTVEEFTQRN